jgi:hypothetical protein
MGFFKKMWGGIKKVGSKVGQGFKKAGRWVADKGKKVIGLAQKGLGVLGMLPGKLGMIGKVGSAGLSVVKGITDQIPNQKAKDAINGVINKSEDLMNKGIQKGSELAQKAQEKATPWVGVAEKASDALNKVVH